jgi:hypothetical protein
MNKVYKAYNALPKKGQQEADEYTRFLMQKYKIIDEAKFLYEQHKGITYIVAFLFLKWCI